MRRFLNRILGLPVSRQNLLFNYFFATLAAEVAAAKAEGRYSEGVSDIGGSNIAPAGPPAVLWREQASGLETRVNELRVDRGVPFEVGEGGGVAGVQGEVAGVVVAMVPGLVWG